MLQELWTPEGDLLKQNLDMQPWAVYPRPQMKRESYLNLNSWWEFTAAKENRIPKEFDLKIRVPFCPEAPLSGIHGHFPEGTNLFYRRNLALPEGFNRGRVILHIGAADQVADVFVNGQEICHHEGGYESFSCDITDALNDEN